MSFNRLRFDNDTYEHDLRQSTGPSAYALGTPQNCPDGACFVADPAVRLGTGGATCARNVLVDVDSEVMGITRRRSRCPTEQYLPSQEPFCRMHRPPDCRTQALSCEDTRLSNPPCTGRGTENGFNRWEFLCADPQRAAIARFPMHINGRVVIKDNWRPCVQRPSEPSALPPPVPAPRLPEVVLPTWLPEMPKTLSWAECDAIAQ
jgi:hypothetical protein